MNSCKRPVRSQADSLAKWTLAMAGCCSTFPLRFDMRRRAGELEAFICGPKLQAPTPVYGRPARL